MASSMATAAMETIYVQAVSTAGAAAAASSSAYPQPQELLPQNNNPALKTPAGDRVLYNATLILMAYALFQHTLVFGILALLRNFNFKRLLDLHYLTLVFALTFVAAPLVFLLTQHIDAIKLFFFLEHVAVEGLIGIRVFFPWLCRHHPGKIILVCWFGISALSIIVACNWEPGFYHGADIIAWAAFISDGFVAAAGAMLIFRWFRKRQPRRRTNTTGYKISTSQRARRKRTNAEAMAGLGFIIHGLTTMPVGPIFTRVLYHNASPEDFAYAWVAVFSGALVAVGLSSPCIAIFLGTINWCCAHNRKVLPGEASFDESDDELLPDRHVDMARNGKQWSGTSADSYKLPELGQMNQLAPS